MFSLYNPTSPVSVADEKTERFIHDGHDLFEPITGEPTERAPLFVQLGTFPLRSSAQPSQQPKETPTKLQNPKNHL